MYDQLKNEKQAENFETIICTTFNGASCPGSKGWPVPSVAPDSWTGYRNVSDCSPLRCMQGEMTSLHCLRQKRKKGNKKRRETNNFIALSPIENNGKKTVKGLIRLAIYNRTR